MWKFFAIYDLLRLKCIHSWEFGTIWNHCVSGWPAMIPSLRPYTLVVEVCIFFSAFAPARFGSILWGWKWRGIESGELAGENWVWTWRKNSINNETHGTNWPGKLGSWNHPFGSFGLKIWPIPSLCCFPKIHRRSAESRGQTPPREVAGNDPSDVTEETGRTCHAEKHRALSPSSFSVAMATVRTSVMGWKAKVQTAFARPMKPVVFAWHAALV